jgi:hypothetical protein
MVPSGSPALSAAELARMRAISGLTAKAPPSLSSSSAADRSRGGHNGSRSRLILESAHID